MIPFAIALALFAQLFLIETRLTHFPAFRGRSRAALMHAVHLDASWADFNGLRMLLREMSKVLR
jgi:hypothetical protein